MSRDSRRPRTDRAREARGRARRRGRDRSRRHGDLQRWIAAALLTCASAAVGFVVVAGGPVVLGWVETSPDLRSIAVQGAIRLDAPTVARASGVERGARLDHLDTESVEARLERHPWIARARAAALPDGTLVVRVEERQPVAWAADSEGSLHWIDEGGFAFARADESASERGALPEITGAVDDELDSGLHAGAPRLARAVALSRLAAERGIPAPVGVGLPRPDPDADSTPGSDAAGWRLRPGGLSLEAWLGEEFARFPERVGRLARLLEEDPAHARRASEIDLRFSGRAFLRFAGEAAAGGESPSPDGAGPSGDSARMRGVVRTRPTG